ncbi:protein cortex [Colletes latitarsis]|uniref:protein cortex n=1 Tax=Colletes latitarsis TaxID=2605962 RepID=UPI0040375EB9
MRRARSRFDNEDNRDENIYTTPLRRSSVRIPRLRLADVNLELKDAKLPAATYRPVFTRIARKKNYSEDRFIVQRGKYNFDAANYNLTKKRPHDSEKENELDVFDQMDSLPEKWRQNNMHRLMVKENVIPGLRQKGVMRGNQVSPENKLNGNLTGLPKDLWNEECIADGMWKAKPRKRPGIHVIDSILDVSGMARSLQSNYNFMDWSSKDVIATASRNSIVLLYTSEEMRCLENVKSSNLCALKWSNDGDKLAICTLSSSTKVFCLRTKTITWSKKCFCVNEMNTQCYARCVCWSKNDQHVVVGCNGLISIYLTTSGELVNSTIAHTSPILKLSFSSNYRYLVSSAMDSTVRLIVWPDVLVCFDLTYYEPVKAMVWHPHENDLLCIGGGLGDASLSLWNVNKLDCQSYRVVEFFGAVENLAWNKLSSELVVQWSYWEEHKQYTIMPVLASLDRFVDAVPVEKDLPIKSIMWNSDHTQLATYNNEFFSTWNFFGDQFQHQRKKRQKQRDYREVNEKSKNSDSKGFNHFTIR